MSRVFRVLRKAYARTPFDGEGAYRYGGRWSSPGVRLSYTSEHQSLAMLEYFVHLDKDDPPTDLVLAVAQIPETVTRESVKVSELPVNWRDGAAPPELTAFGDEFVSGGKSCLLFVPSVLAPHENNCLINPGHPEFGRITVQELEPLTISACLRSAVIGHQRNPEYHSEPAQFRIVTVEPALGNPKSHIQLLRPAYLYSH